MVIVYEGKGRCGRLEGGRVKPLPAVPFSDPNRTPTTYSSAEVSGKDGESEDGNRSDTLIRNVENEGCERWLSLNQSIELSTKDIDLDEFFKRGVRVSGWRLQGAAVFAGLAGFKYLLLYVKHTLNIVLK